MKPIYSLTQHNHATGRVTEYAFHSVQEIGRFAASQLTFGEDVVAWNRRQQTINRWERAALRFLILCLSAVIGALMIGAAVGASF